MREVGQGSGNPRLGPGVGIGVTFANPTQKSETMTPEPTPPAGQRGSSGLQGLKRGRRRGSCKGACPSWSRKSFLPG